MKRLALAFLALILLQPSFANAMDQQNHLNLLLLQAVKKTDLSKEEQAKLNFDLCMAGFNANPKRTKALLDAGADIEYCSPLLGTVLIAATIRGDLPTCKLLLERGACPNTRNSIDETALFYAVFFNHESIGTLLLESNAEINEIWSCEQTPLSLAAGKDHKGFCELLIQYGAHVNAKIPTSGSALIQAAALGHDSTCELLLSHGANQHIKNEKGRTALICTAHTLKDRYRALLELEERFEGMMNTEKEYEEKLGLCNRLAKTCNILIHHATQQSTLNALLQERDREGKTAFDYIPDDWKSMVIKE